MNCTGGCEDIYLKLKAIFRSRFDLNFDNLGEAALDKNLLGSEIRFAPRDLLCLFFDIEKEFDITIPQETIIAGKFNTFNNIVVIICTIQEGKRMAV
ncbi:MAG: peptide maturation system acyl carrier-related protein [Clostridia bacterium]|nr:peptide maturation system acyl carrier-related protein [Clostridia bacterium]